MRIYVLRHGHSPSLAESGADSDGTRPLSEQGRKDVRHAAQRLATAGAKPSCILASPLLRAQQSAEEAASILRPSQGTRTFAPLANEIDGGSLYKRLSQEMAGVPELLLVGHQPQLGEMIATLTGKTVALQPGGIAALETEQDSRATLLWSQNP